ncbi:hypothetical protein [Haloarcula litorea]|uniref:hypothetical protein n=1 Tax=Haloarcula litorea TaxID=3032579 RepID=UPI0023E8EB76|nr:hypothetical protein [Halomicroarcula sp. GDY20]
MSWLRENRHWLLFAATVLSGLGAAGVAFVGVVATVVTLVTGGPILGIVAGSVLGTLLLLGVAVVAGTKLASTLAGMASFPTNRRAADALARAERLVPPLSRLGLADRLAPSVEERRAELTQRYVDGDLTEAAFERELRDLLEDADEDGSGMPDREVAVDAADADEREVEAEKR